MLFFNYYKYGFIFILAGLFFMHCKEANPSSINAKPGMIDFQEISIEDALNNLAKRLDMNLIISQTVHGTASLHLKNTSPRDAFDLLLMSHQLSQYRIKNSWYIVPRGEFVQIKQQEMRLQSIIDDAEPLLTLVWQIHYAKAEDIAKLLKSGNGALLSKRGHVYVDVRTNILCVQDIAARLEELKRLIRRLDVPVQQVLIEVQLASIDSNYERELGVHFEDQQTTKAEAAQETRPMYSPLTTHYGLALLKLTDGSFIRMQLSALEKQGHGELISSPSLFTANQQTASIESGEEIPYQEISRSGATGVSFKKAVLSLQVTPQVMPGHHVLLQLQVNQDKPSSRMILGVPSITTRQMSTHILIKSGQTIVLGGIYESDKGQQRQGVPVINKIPLVGWLFKQQNVTNNKRELLIFVTPRVIN